jgi:hypothetical protein
MDRKIFDDTVERLIELNKTVVKLDPAIRSSAFELLKGYVTGVQAKTPADEKTKREHDGAGPDLEALIGAHPDSKPYENVEILAAHWYAQYGATPFSLENLRSAAIEGGLIIPDRTDMTLRQVKEGGKKLFQSAGRGLFKPTVPGELYLKKTYNVRKGSGSPPVAAKK